MGVTTPPMTGKTVLITGGTGGIGRAAAIGLASMGARVGITGRDRARAERAALDEDHRQGDSEDRAFSSRRALSGLRSPAPARPTRPSLPSINPTNPTTKPENRILIRLLDP
jgi:NAD(P)-dependent dehydrogenase (short-subunit alcohol dehydrogenase family)